MELTGSYIAVSGSLTFLQAARSKHRKNGQTAEEQLVSVPESSFKWHQVDLRTPLPPLEALSDAPHPLGIHEGKRAYLCGSDQALSYPVVTVSKEFTEHYGERVYICFS